MHLLQFYVCKLLRMEKEKEQESRTSRSRYPAVVCIPSPMIVQEVMFATWRSVHMVSEVILGLF